jgi:hypothetical protein
MNDEQGEARVLLYVLSNGGNYENLITGLLSANGAG